MIEVVNWGSLNPFLMRADVICSYFEVTAIMCTYGHAAPHVFNSTYSQQYNTTTWSRLHTYIMYLASGTDMHTRKADNRLALSI